MKISVQLHYHPDSATHIEALQICKYLVNIHKLVNIYLAEEGVGLITDTEKLADWMDIAHTANIDITACSSSCNRFGITSEQLEDTQVQTAGQLQLLKQVNAAEQNLIFNS